MIRPGALVRGEAVHDARRDLGERRMRHRGYRRVVALRQEENTIIVATAGQGMLRSNNNGQSWHRLEIKERAGEAMATSSLEYRFVRH
jgi:hypothetical protein